MDFFAKYSSLVLVIGLGMIELHWYRKQKRTYAVKDSILSIADSLLRKIMMSVLGWNLFFSASTWLWPLRLVQVSKNSNIYQRGFRITFLFFGLEFLYYWQHRLSHKIRWLWATHAVHHSPNDLNVITGLRSGWTQNFSGAILAYAPLVILGFTTAEIITGISFILLYQTWIHTDMIGKLGWLEKIFNTPSHHRAHHGSNPIYLDKNYGGILIIFDRLFGTFVEETEEEPVTYGLVKPLDSWNPIYISVHEWILMGRNVCKSWSSPSDIFGYLFAAPGWSPDGKGLLAADKNAEDVNKRADLQRQDP